MTPISLVSDKVEKVKIIQQNNVQFVQTKNVEGIEYSCRI